jgi:uncharacterized membrane protein YtjA (UPF0391 family)
MVVWLLEYPKRSPWGQFLQACEAETLLIAAFLGFGSLAESAALIAKVCFVLFLIFAIVSFLKTRSPTALRYQEGLTRPFSLFPPETPGLIAIGLLSPAALPTRYFRLGSFKALRTSEFSCRPRETFNHIAAKEHERNAIGRYDCLVLPAA